jgi:hypothetical protein
MADNYTPQFQHQDWRDNVDLVSAEDPVQGFNKRFNDLQKEFKTIAGIIRQINDSLAPNSTTLTFAPNFSPDSSSDSSHPWKQVVGGAVKDPNQDTATGWFTLQMPNNWEIERITVFGKKRGRFSFQIQLLEQAIADPNSNRPLFLIQLASEPDGAFEKALSPQQRAPVRINNLANKYLFFAQFADADPRDSASIFTIQILLHQA